jgi:putative acyl-CoA dehydrogenase
MSFDGAASQKAAASFQRVATPVGKYWINKRVVNFVYEAMEALGGAGYIEESAMPRLYRQSPLNSIWEGSGNVICLDVLRALSRDPDSAAAFIAEIELAKGQNKALDGAIERTRSLMGKPPEERGARHLVESMALTLQGAVLTRSAPNLVADAFCATRLGERSAFSFGAFDSKVDTDAILARAMPAA